MEIFKGSATFSGIAIGNILYYHREAYQVRQCFVNNVKKELGDFEKARKKVLEELAVLYEDPDTEKKRHAGLLEKGSFIRAVESMIETEKVNAAYAVATTRDELSQTFRNLEEPAVRERIEDVREISDRLISVLGGLSSTIFLGEKPVILVAEKLSPGEILEMEKEKLLAVVTHQGSEISHASIMAKTIGIPALVDVKIEEEWDGIPAIVDGYTGTLYLDPDKELLKEYETRQRAEKEEKEELLKLKDKKAVTLDGHEVGIYANIANLDDLNSVLFYGAEGIGLLRSEFQYLGRENYPRENELFRAYKKVAETMGDCPAVIRTVDLGADKQSSYMDIPEEKNPIMGNRGIRLCLDRKRMFKAQLRAIYRASAYGNLAVMYPMITSLEELEEIEKMTAQVKAGLREKGISYKDIPVSVMIETPAAAMMTREIAEKVDFLSLGTNDLAQYTLAMDRQNPLLKEKYDDHHPAVLKLIHMVIQKAHEKNKKVFICGELAADTALTETFIKMGVDALSVVPACILPVRKAVRSSRREE